VIAIEPATGMRAQRNNGAGGDLAWLAGRAEALPLRQGTVDVAWLCCVIHYLHLPAAGVEIRRVLRPDGRVLVRSVFPDRFDDLVWLRWFPAARAIDEARMPTVDHLRTVWDDIGVRLEKRIPAQHLVADDLHDLADRLSHRAISTLELISDDDFNAGLDKLRSDAHVLPRAPVYSTVDTLVFTLS
jgi:SAM-dependent methyltransferase